MTCRSGNEFNLGRYAIGPTVRWWILESPFPPTVVRLTRHSPLSGLAMTGSAGELTESRCLRSVVVVGDKIDRPLL